MKVARERYGVKDYFPNYGNTLQKTQVDKFREAARRLETDDNKQRFDERLGKIAKPKPATDSKPDDRRRDCARAHTLAR